MEQGKRVLFEPDHVEADQRAPLEVEGGASLFFHPRIDGLSLLRRWLLPKVVDGEPELCRVVDALHRGTVGSRVDG